MSTNNSFKQTILPQILFYIFLIILVSIFFIVSNPFLFVLTSRAIVLSGLNNNQITNITLASGSVNQTILKPGELFSFNKVVGPRTGLKGYKLSNTYLQNSNIQTFGGGICLFSSILYQCALEAGLQIHIRTPHTKTIKTIKPGLDATVDYEQADLSFINPYNFPIKIFSYIKDGKLIVIFKGNKNLPKVILKSEVKKTANKKIIVSVYKYTRNKKVLITRDTYQLAR
jgi:vancomycin resistance protein YoaR